MKIVGLCPTYRRPALLTNSLWLWLEQAYPESQRHLMILDDAGTFDSQQGDGWELISAPHRLPSLPDKYQYMVDHAPPDTDAFVPWEDDDIFLPGFLAAHAACLQQHEYSQPLKNLCQYGTDIIDVDAGYHGSMAMTKDLLGRVGGYPQTQRIVYDSMLQKLLREEATSVGEPWTTYADSQFVMGFGRPGPVHIGIFAKGVDDVTWYDRCVDAYPEVPTVGKLVPACDVRTQKVFTALREGRRDAA